MIWWVGNRWWWLSLVDKRSDLDLMLKLVHMAISSDTMLFGIVQLISKGLNGLIEVSDLGLE